jgi:hypothetical protein
MKNLFSVLISLLTFTAQSQVSIGYSGRIGLFSPSAMLSVADGGYITIKKVDVEIKGKGWNTFRQAVTLVKYDKEFKPLSQVKLANGTAIYNGNYGELVKVGPKFWLIYLEARDSDDMGDIKAVEVNPETLAVAEPKVIASGASLNHRITKILKVYDLLFQTRVSPSGKYVCLYVRMSDSDFYISCIDDNMKPVWGKKESIEGIEKPGICSMEADDAGKVYLGYIKKDGPNYSIYFSSAKVKSVQVKLTEGSAKEILFHPSKNNSVFVSGTYINNDHCTGVYKASLNQNGELSSITTTPFPASVIDPLDKEGWASNKSKKYGLYQAFTAEPVKLEDGSSGMLAEFHRRTEAARGNYLHAGSLLFIDFKKATPTFTRVPKYSLGSDIFNYAINSVHKSGCFYYTYPFASKMIFFYFDTPENFTRDMSLDAKVVNPNNQVLAAAIVEQDGTIKRQSVMTQPLSSVATEGKKATQGSILIPLLINGIDVIANVKL